MKVVAMGCTLITAALLHAGIAIAQDHEGLKALTQIAPEYQKYRLQTVSLPISIPGISLKVISKVNSFVATVPGGSGGVRMTPTMDIVRLSLDNQEKEQAAKLFDQVVIDAVSKKFMLNKKSDYLLLVVSGEGGGMIIGTGGTITSKVFLLNTRDKILLAYSDQPTGMGATVNAALENLAIEVTEKFSEMAKPLEGQTTANNTAEVAAPAQPPAVPAWNPPRTPIFMFDLRKALSSDAHGHVAEPTASQAGYKIATQDKPPYWGCEAKQSAPRSVPSSRIMLLFSGYSGGYATRDEAARRAIEVCSRLGRGLHEDNASCRVTACRTGIGSQHPAEDWKGRAHKAGKPAAAPTNTAQYNLIDAAAAGDLSRVRALLAAKANVNAKRADSFTALMISSQQGHQEVVRALLAAKADVNAKTTKGETALMLASANGHPEVVEALLAAKADVKAKSANGLTALSVARDAKVRTLLMNAGSAATGNASPFQSNAAAAKTGADSPSAPTIAFDRNKISRDAVVAAVSSVFLAHGYKSSAHQEAVHRVQAGQPAKQLDWGGPIRFIDAELQPPLGGSGKWHSKPWHYKALINDDTVVLQVYVKVDPVQFMGLVFDESQVPLQPPDMKAIVQELQTKLR